jgi:hypothetical protein
MPSVVKTIENVVFPVCETKTITSIVVLTNPKDKITGNVPMSVQVILKPGMDRRKESCVVH